jgi:hypothetical protein
MERLSGAGIENEPALVLRELYSPPITGGIRR